ncbi:hypothetical protein DJ530_09975 [Sulfolobus sp. E1]|nr:hypothetical protein DJ530_09975 [Sulfolobus sp. E1]
MDVIPLSKEFICDKSLHKVMEVRLRELIIFSLISVIIIISAISIPIVFSQDQSASNIFLAPSGYLPISIPTTGSSASFTFYVINDNPTSETVTIYLNGNQQGTLSLGPYSYKSETLSLPVGKNVIYVSGQSLIVNVIKVSSLVNGEVLLNNSVGQLLIKGEQGASYTVNLTMAKIINWNASKEALTDSPVFSTNMYYVYSFPINLQAPFSNSSFVLIKVPPYIPQGLYYFFSYIEFYNISNYNQVLGYLPFFIFVNISYGLNGTIVTSNTYTSNGITVSFTTFNNYTYILSKYPFSKEDKVIVEVIPQSSSLSKFITKLMNYSVSIPLPGGTSGSAQYYGSNNAEFAYTNSSIELKIPEQYTGSSFQLNITYVTPTGTISTGIIPQITTTSTSTTSTTTTSTTSTTTSTTTTSTTSTSTTSSTSSTTSTSTTSSITTTTPTTSTTSATITTSSTTSTTTAHISTPLLIGIVIVIIVIVIIAVVLLRRR